MKNILIKGLVCCSILFSIQSCSQNKKEMDNKATELLGNLYKDVKYMDRQVSYHAIVSTGGATVEVYINGYPIHRVPAIAGRGGNSGGSNPINKYILKSGEQNWEVRVYPAYNSDGTQQAQLSKEARFTIRLDKLRFNDNGVDNLADPVTLLETPKAYETSATGNTEEAYKDAGKPMMIYKGTFNADVPYSLKGWSESSDLTKEDQDVLKKELVSKYEELRNILANRQSDKFAEKILGREKEISQSLFYTKVLNDDYMKTFFDKVTKNGKKMEKLENYKMVFYGNKMVALETSDINYLYNPILAATYSDGKKEKLITYYVTFHRPKAGGPLEIIR
ncbi:hypothetical protein [Elizabethkingia ursingii]|uniref:Uncharacterized protein n=1 Tax=Elizabethkingia ursingii TaxID=1756150 RepID=A0ABX3NF55_9FLAO|nr:hypothetical protein [Elizabethkingia ursingii]OPB94441.1 hypothetical protein BB021_17700 [Elizabethkingia ursingii]